MTDVRRSEEDKEAETETEANQRGWHSARLEVQKIYLFLVWPNFFRDFISSIALFKPEENQDEKKKAKKDEKKVEKPAKKQVKLGDIEGKVFEIHFSF